MAGGLECAAGDGERDGDDAAARYARELRVEQLGGQGCTDAMIGARLGMSQAAMAEMAAADAGFAASLKAAEAGRVHWWSRRVLEMYQETGDIRLWALAYRMRYPDDPLPWERAPPPPQPYRPRWRGGRFY